MCAPLEAYCINLGVDLSCSLISTNGSCTDWETVRAPRPLALTPAGWLILCSKPASSICFSNPACLLSPSMPSILAYPANDMIHLLLTCVQDELPCARSMRLAPCCALFGDWRGQFRHQAQ